MKLSYLILAHDDLPQVLRMISALRGNNTLFYVHVDKKINWDVLKKYFHGEEDIKILRNRLDIKWGGFNMVKATISLLKAAYKANNDGYFVLLSGKDFPIKSNTDIFEFLSNNFGKQYLEFFQLPNERWIWNGGLDRIEKFWMVDKLGLEMSYSYYYFQRQTGVSRDFFEDFVPYGGSQWWCITRECAGYILKFLDDNKIYEEYFELTFIPDETFFNTIIMNSPFKESVINDNLKFIDWSEKKPNPKVFSGTDVPRLISSEQLWARKFNDENITNTILKMLKTKER